MYIDKFDVNHDDIYNPIQKDDFISNVYSHLENESITNIIRLFNLVGISERQNQKDFCNFNFSEVIDLFEINEWKKTNTFTHNKSILKIYVEWCKAENKISGDSHPIERIQKEDIVGARKFHRQYFKDFNEFKDCLEQIYNNAEVEDIQQFVFNKMTLCLLWLRFSKEEIRLMRKDNVSFINNTITSPLDNEYVVSDVDDYIMNLASDCIEAKECYARNRFGITTLKYQNNDFLIRTLVRKRFLDADPISEYYFNNLIGRFREIAQSTDLSNPYHQKGITIESVFLSGAYNWLYALNQNQLIFSNDYEVLSKASRYKISSQLALSYFFHDYTAWKKFYYGK